AASTASIASKDAAPLAASRLTRRYYDYNLSSMKDSHGGFLIDEPDDNDANGEANGKDGQTASLLDIAAASKKQLAKCEECSSQDVDAKYLEAFGVKICRVCKEALSEKYSLLTKTEVKSDYMLTDSELTDTKAMPYIEKPNPHKATWNNMRLYLRMQVEAFALKKWGSFENMDAEYQRREAEKVIKKEQRFKSKLDDLRRRTRTSTWK
ncbi:DNA repair protein, partial [Ramicandelaber brevisporus]